MEQFTEQEFIEIRALIDAYKNGKTIANLPVIDSSEQDYNQLLLEVYNTEAQTPGRIPVSLFKGLVDISGWTGTLPSVFSNPLGTKILSGQITENWKPGVMYVIYYTSELNQVGGTLNSEDLSAVFTYPKDPTSAASHDCVYLLDRSPDSKPLHLKKMIGNTFESYNYLIYKIYRVK